MYKGYVLKSRRFLKSYVGIAQDENKRLEEHNSGKSFYTRRYLPWDIIYTEAFNTREEARKREKYFKSATGRRFLRKFVFRN